LCLVAALLPAACGGPPDAIYGVGETETEAQVLKIIPLGSEVDFAKTQMEARGFYCSMSYGQRHAVRDPDDPIHYSSSAPGNFLLCAADRSGGFLVTKEYRVVFDVIGSGTVASVEVLIYRTGL
jgi:hypothetical protein